MKSLQKILLVIIGLIIVIAGGFYLYQKMAPKSPITEETPTIIGETPAAENTGTPLESGEPTQMSAQIANPASVNCVNLGGNLIIQKHSDGGEYGVCFFEDNRQCEEWALFRGNCPKGGVKITGYQTEAEIFCAITGGQVENLDTETPLCKRIDGTLCNAQANFDGACPDPSDPTPNAGNGEAL